MLLRLSVALGLRRGLGLLRLKRCLDRILGILLGWEDVLWGRGGRVCHNLLLRRTRRLRRMRELVSVLCVLDCLLLGLWHGIR